MTRFKNNSRSMYSGPLSKMVKDAVEEHMSALKSEHDVEWSDWKEKSRTTDERGATTITEGRTGTTPGTEPTREVEKIVRPGEPGYEEWLAAVEANPDLERLLGYVGTEGTEVEEERQRVEEPEIEQIQRKEVDKIDVDESKERKPEYVSAEIPDRSLASIFNLNPDRAGFMTSHAAEFFDQKFSVDNPTFDVLKDNKFMKKARKEYEKSMKGAGNRKRMTLPFERWVMQSYRPGGSGDTLINQARTWQRDNPMDDDGSHMENPDGSEAIIRTTPKGTRGNRNRPDQPSWYDKADVEGGETTAAPKLKFANPKHPLNKRTMSFRRKR